MASGNEAHPRTPARLDYERRYERQFRSFRLRMDGDRGEVFEQLCRDNSLAIQSVLNALALALIRTSPATQEVFASLLKEMSPERASKVLALTLDRLPKNLASDNSGRTPDEECGL